MLEHRVVHAQFQQLAARRVLVRDQVDGVVGPDAGRHDLVLEARELLHVVVGADEVVLELAAVAVRHRGHDEIRIAPIVECDLRHLREVLAQHVHVLGRIRAEPVEVHLLEEMLLIGRPLRSGIARVPKSLAVAAPGQAAAAGGVLDAGNDVAQLLAAGDIEQVQRAVLAAVLGQRDGNGCTVRRRDEPVDRRRTLRIEDVGVDHHPRLRRIGGIAQHRDHGLLIGR